MLAFILAPGSITGSVLRAGLVAVLLGSAHLANAADAPAPANDALRGITVPAGFTVEVACAAPLVGHPLMADFDDRGRLYVAESAGQNLEADELLAQTPNFVRRLEDTDGDGRFDRSTIFADKMTMPMGALWHAGALYVASPPHIWRLEDTDDDGVADRREAIVGRFGFIGNAADIHGCFLHPNGRLYWCDGRHGHEFVDENGITRSKGQAARIFSCRPDGSDVQALCGGGMDNPVEVDFTSEGEVLGTVNLFYQQRGDCLVHWMHGGAYPRFDQAAAVAEFKRTGELLPPVLDLGHVAVSGMTRYRGAQFGRDFTDNLFITQFNTHRVVRTVLTRDGSTFRATSEVFWNDDNPDCHPTDVLEDADGSLLVIDTGGWFRNGCPTSQVAKPEVLGTIYRVRRAGAPTVADPRGQQIDWALSSPPALAALLADQRYEVVDRAVAQLALRGAAAIPALSKVLSGSRPESDVPSADRQIKQQALWALTRIETPAALATIRAALDDKDPAVRQTAVASISATRDPAARQALSQILLSDEPPLRREAATALGRLRDAAAVPDLLTAAASASDRLLEHAILYALIEIDDRSATLAGLQSSDDEVRRAALIALDQMDSGALTQELVADTLDTDHARLQQTVIDVIARHPAWAGSYVAQLKAWLGAAELTLAQRAMARGALVTFVGHPTVQELIGATLAAPTANPAARAIVLESLARADLREFPAPWTPSLSRLLRDGSPAERELTLAAIQPQAATFTDELRSLAAAAALDPALRLKASIALGHAGTTLTDDESSRLQSALVASSTPLERLEIAAAIGSSHASDAQLEQLIELVPPLGALELSSVLRAFAHCSQPAIGERLLVALGQSPALETLSPPQLAEVLAQQPETTRAAAASLLAARQPNAHEIAAELARLEADTTPGDAERGRQIFFGSQAGCAACHAIGGRGEQIGPDLSKIGAIRTRRDLLEAVSLPSSSLARGYESYVVATTDGLTHQGIVRRETPDALWLRTADRTEVKIARGEIESQELSPQSIMPVGLMKLLDAQQRADLLAYLLSLR